MPAARADGDTGCRPCQAYAAERTVEGREPPAHGHDGCTRPATQPLDVLFVAPAQFRASPQVGTPCLLAWAELARTLSLPMVGQAKDEAGAWSPARYRDGIRRKANLEAVGALVVDLDDGGDVDVAARVVGRYQAIVHETFSSTPEAPRCRVVIRLSEPIDAPTYEAVHRIVRGHLAGAGLPADEGAKDASRLSYAPVRRPGTGYRFRCIDGAPLDARAVLAAQPPPPPPRLPSQISPGHRDAYVRAALRAAADAVAGAQPGVRHHVLCREAFALARLVEEGQIASVLLPAFVAAAGERREGEGRRTIRDAVRARRRGA